MHDSPGVTVVKLLGVPPDQIKQNIDDLLEAGNTLLFANNEIAVFSTSYPTIKGKK
jgi:hypothetical protein